MWIGCWASSTSGPHARAASRSAQKESFKRVFASPMRGMFAHRRREVSENTARQATIPRFRAVISWNNGAAPRNDATAPRRDGAPPRRRAAAPRNGAPAPRRRAAPPRSDGAPAWSGAAAAWIAQFAVADCRSRFQVHRVRNLSRPPRSPGTVTSACQRSMKRWRGCATITFHDSDEIGLHMLARIAKKARLKRGDL
jgi:hypothetical protein